MNKYREMMSLHTSMKVGGPATVYFENENEEELLLKVRESYRSDAPYIVIGNGTNIIVRDGGYPGAVFTTNKTLNGVELIENEKDNASKRIKCGAGESLANVCKFAASNGLSGLEALSGIPGTIGGAVVMNAGAYEHEISDVLVMVRAYDIQNDSIVVLSKPDFEFGYRNSVFKRKQMIVLEAEFELVSDNKADIEARMAEYRKRRNEKQPMELPSAGSYFKRPEGNYAGKLIEEAGMKGASVGGAMVSKKHAGFIVNTGGATASDVLELAEQVKTKVYNETGIRLEEEPIVIGI